MPECQNCGSHVSTEYVRVFAPDEEEDPRACPFCEDMVREDGKVREARSSRARANGVKND